MLSTLLRSAVAVATTFVISLIGTAPTPTQALLRRDCRIEHPAIIVVTKRSDPDMSFHDGHFRLQRTGGPPYLDTISTAITFDYIPADATGCMLQIDLPPFAVNNAIANGTATQADVWTTQPWNYDSEPTWNHPALKNAMVATTIFPTQRSTTGYKTILASNSCSRVMSFQFELSGWQQGAGSVDFFNTWGGKPGLVPIGFTMIYSC